VVSQSSPDRPVNQAPPVLRPNDTRLRAIRIKRIGLAVAALLVAVLVSDHAVRAFAAAAGLLWVVSAMIVPRAGRVYLAATETGLESPLFGLITWDEIAALNVRESNHGRSLEIFDRDRKTMIRRARSPFLRAWMFLTQPFNLPLLRITEQMASFDALAYRAQLEQFAGRTFHSAEAT
jgi:hypothetical protein